MVANCIEMKREGWGDYRLNRIVKIRVVKLCFKFFDSKRLFRFANRMHEIISTAFLNQCMAYNCLHKTKENRDPTKDELRKQRGEQVSDNYIMEVITEEGLVEFKLMHMTVPGLMNYEGTITVLHSTPMDILVI